MQVRSETDRGFPAGSALWEQDFPLSSPGPTAGNSPDVSTLSQSFIVRILDNPDRDHREARPRNKLPGKSIYRPEANSSP